MKNNFLSSSDSIFDYFLPEKYQEISKVHWTPEKIIDIVIEWFKVQESKRILDIGSGVGKFCIRGAQKSKMEFIGIEKRLSLYSQANEIKNKLKLTNVKFIHDNILNIDFNKYDSFYYFNPFYEQVCWLGRIDKETIYSSTKFRKYQDYVFNELNKKVKGTTVITYCAPEFKLPKGYLMKNIMFEGLLQLWVKN